MLVSPPEVADESFWGDSMFDDDSADINKDEDKVEDEVKLSSFFKRHSSSCKCASLKEINKQKNE